MFQWLAKFFRQDAIFQPASGQAPATAKDVEQIVRSIVQGAVSNLPTKEYVKKVVDDGIVEFIESVKPEFQKMATKEDLERYVTKEDLEQGFREQRYYFDAAVENIEDSLRGANNDEISGLKDADHKLDQRVTVVERQIGLPAA